MKTFVEYTKAEIKANTGNIENIAFELMARCISQGVRIIIEQGEGKGHRYIMVDFSPTDKSNTDFIMDDYVCAATSIDGDDEGEINKDFTTYVEACSWLTSFLIGEDYTCVYTETY